MSNLNERWPKKAKYISAADDLEGRGPLPVVILSLEWEPKFVKYVATFAHYRDGMDLAAPQLLKPCLAFIDDTGEPVAKAVVLNKSNCFRIAQVYGEASVEVSWLGALVQLSSHPVSNPHGPGMVAGILAQPIARPATVRATPEERAALERNAQPPPAPPTEPERLAAEMNAEPSEMPGAHLELEGEGRFF